jgi:N-acetylneuraminic acid mutarotase
MGAVRKGSDTHVYVFGGGTYDSSMTLRSAPDKFWDYDVSTGQWHDLSYLGGPSPRSGALMIARQDDLFLFGGIANLSDSGYITHNDLWKFDTERMVWSLLSNNTGPKKKRIAMGGTIGLEDDKKLLVYGGERFVPLSWEFPIDRETWTWDIAKGAWTRNVDGPARNKGVFGTNTGGALMFGGDEEGGVVGCGAPFYQNPTNDLFYYDAQQGTWTKIVEATNTPEPVKRTAGVWAAGYLYVFGGFDFVCDSEDDPGQIWNETVYRLKVGE